MATKFLNLSTDTTLGGVSPSDEIAVSQKAIKTYVDNQGGGGSSTLAGLSDVTLTSPTDGQVLTYDNGTWINAESAGGYHPDLFSWQWADHKLNDVQWLRADTFSWQSGAVYQAAYAHLVLDIDGKTLQSETISGTTIQFYLADDGHKICPASEESNVTAIYNATGVAWYYILDTVNQRFKLPRSSHNKYLTSLSVVGNGKGLSLTNGSVTFGIQNDTDQSACAWGKSSQNVGAAIGSSANRDIGLYSNIFGVSQDPTLSGLTTTTIEQDTDQYKYLYFYVGNFTQTALENTAGLNTELFNGKADVSTVAHVVTEFQEPTSANNYTWYRKYADGWVEQGGITKNIANNSNVNVSLPITMSDTNYTVTIAQLADTSYFYTNQGGLPYNGKYTTYIVLTNRRFSGEASRTIDINWQVSGMAQG